MTVEAALDRSLIVIPSVGGAYRLKRLLPTLRAPGRIVVVIDAAGRDDTLEVCRDAGVEVHQAGRRLTYVQACNLGAALAEERGCEFLFVGRDDVALTTDVCRELLSEMLLDERLGIAAPTQVAVDGRTGRATQIFRAVWHLDRGTFGRDTTPPAFDAHRLEADFCDLAFALIRLSAMGAVGPLDAEQDCPDADADFCYRLGMAGFSSAYLAHSQIVRHVDPTHDQQPSSSHPLGADESRRMFASRHLGYGVQGTAGLALTPVWMKDSERLLEIYLRRYGLLDDRRPRLSMDYATSTWVWETGPRPDRRAEAPAPHDSPARAQIAPAVETDLFNPWGPTERLAPGRAIAWFGLPTAETVDAVARMLRPAGNDVRLILIGAGASLLLPSDRATMRRWRDATIRESFCGRVLALDSARLLENDDVRARFLRSVDFTLWTATDGAAVLGAAESLACGTPVIAPRHAAFSRLAIDGGIGLPAGVEDGCGRGEIGALASAIGQALALDARSYRYLSEQGVLRIRQELTWRHAIYRLRRSLAEVQDRLPVPEKTDGPDKDAPSRSGLSRMASGVRNQLRRASALLARLADDWEKRGSRHAAGAFGRRVQDFGARHADALRSRIVGRLHVARRRTSDPKRAAAFPRKRGILFLGYVEAGLGLGESLRGLVSAYASGSQPFAIYPFEKGVETRLIGPFMPERYDRSGRYDVVVVEVAADQLPKVEDSVPPEILAGARRVLRTYWELPAAPAAWRSALRGIDEIWAPNTFVADAFRDIFDGDIVVIPPCIEPEIQPVPKRSRYDLEDGRFYFLFTFDYFSFPARKNPQAVLEAFQVAFPDPSEMVGLVIKSTGADTHHPELKRAFLAAAEADPRIRILDETMSRADVHGLIQTCDCYMSLHRSEGFGFGMAEAMFYGKPVVATRYSGNADFLTPETGFPVDFRLRPVGEDEYVWVHGQVWAEPDMGSAVDALRTVYRRPELRRQRAAAAAAFIRSHYGAFAVRRAIEARLQEIEGQGPSIA